jgi:hypothetical protein
VKAIIYSDAHAPCRDAVAALAGTYEVADIASLHLWHRTIPAVVVEIEGLVPVVLDVESPADLDPATWEQRARALQPQPPEPDSRDVMIEALAAKVGAPTAEELAAARDKLRGAR